ncbi:hypothetical protein [Ornithinimicrobium pratense]|uniref:VOC family protein n=1 Tax=Ornithinimicrobium pratense TaxID=2593973 RepID=A0A5J6V9K0_9MICO|nr:hypothetical protein [Ornithinimicrobium pratense]QFG69833.1 hypothetical protein FY030_15000 [Ornithinimicrobium pratense]
MSTLTGPTPRPIRFTADLPGWQRILQTLGGTLISEHPGWLVYQLGGGRVALHAAHPDQPAGTTTIAIETPVELEQAVAEAAAHGVPVTLEDSDHGPAGHVRAADGTFLWLDAPTPVAVEATRGGGEATRPELSVLPIWYAVDTAMPRAVLEGLGARPRIVGDAGTWADFTFDGRGLAAVHGADESGTELSFEWAGVVEDAQALLTAAGIDCLLIDETYSRTLQVADPDGGKRIWINERQTDLYGYTDLSTG